MVTKNVRLVFNVNFTLFFSIDNLASQAKMYTKYLNVKTKLHKTIANIYYNKGCLKHKLTPTYAKIKIKDTNKAATKTKEQSQTQRIKNELKYLQIKKSEKKQHPILPSEKWSQNIREKLANN